MVKGRQALAGTYEAREYVGSGKFDVVVNSLEISQEAKDRLMKATKFGLGIKDKASE